MELEPSTSSSAPNSASSHRPRADDSDDLVISAVQPTKKRKIRAQLNCNECRRLKMRCDRQTPCSNCVRRECVELCSIPEQARRQTPSVQPPPQDNTQRRLQALEDLLSRNGIQLPPPHPSSDVPIFSPPIASTSSSSHHATQMPPAQDSSTFHPVPSSSVRSGSISDRSPQDHHNNPLSHAAAIFTSAGQHNASFDLPGPSTQQSMSPHDVSAFTAPVHEPQVVGPSPPFDHEEQSFGTLVISKSGASKYLGRTAASEWLKNQEVVENGESPPPTSRPLSPNPNQGQGGSSQTDLWTTVDSFGAKVAFPFNTASRSISTASFLAMLPPRLDGKVLVDAYFRHFSWHFNIAPYEQVSEFFDKVYAPMEPKDMTSLNYPPHDLALLFVVFAMGTYYNLELPPDDSSIEDYLKISKCCLAKGDFMANNTIPALQTLNIMAHLQLSMESGKNGDAAWPLWGLSSRMIQAMGLHRDGERWNLPVKDVEQRRRVFWEAHSTDVMVSNDYSRPGSLNPAYIDTSFPSVNLEEFHRSKFQLSFIFDAVLDHTMKVVSPPYSQVQALHDQIISFERSVPFNCRCRLVLSALPSLYSTPESAAQASPATNKRDLHLTFQQFTLAMNICELLVFLHRPYFARAINESPKNPDRSIYGQSYLAVVERCSAIGVIASSTASIYPQAAARHWWIWYHAFNSAACMGTLVLKNPQNLMAPFAISVIDSITNSYAQVVRSRNSPRMVKNLKWLIKLREKISVKTAQAPEEGLGSGVAAGEQSDEDDVELLGWRTRLIERAGTGMKKARTIQSNAANSVSPSTVLQLAQETAASGQHGGYSMEQNNAMANASLDIDGESLLNSFWNPMVQQDGMNWGSDVTSLNWWLAPEFEGVLGL